MNVLVIGGNGFIGQHLLCSLRQNPTHRITNIYRNRCDDLLTGIQHYNINRKDRPALQRFLDKKKFDVTVDLAAFTPKDIASLFTGLQTHIYIFISSCAVYGEATGMEICEKTQPTNFQHKYGQNKWLAEKEVSNHHPLFAIIRPAIVYGSKDSNKQRGDYFFSQITKKEIFIPGNMEVRNNYLYVLDLVDLICKNFYIKSSVVMNAGGLAFDWWEYIETVSKVTGYNIPKLLCKGMNLVAFREYAKRNNISFPHNVFHDFVLKNNVSHQLGWAPKTKLLDGLRSYYSNR